MTDEERDIFAVLMATLDRLGTSLDAALVHVDRTSDVVDKLANVVQVLTQRQMELRERIERLEARNRTWDRLQ